MQALGLVRISKKQSFVKISFKKISECKKMGLGIVLLIPHMPSFSMTTVAIRECIQLSGQQENFPQKYKRSYTRTKLFFLWGIFLWEI